jgi:hypothetical protein
MTVLSLRLGLSKRSQCSARDTVIDVSALRLGRQFLESGVVSPLIANIHLDQFDQMMKARGQVEEAGQTAQATQATKAVGRSSHAQ